MRKMVDKWLKSTWLIGRKRREIEVLVRGGDNNSEMQWVVACGRRRFGWRREQNTEQDAIVSEEEGGARGTRGPLVRKKLEVPSPNPHERTEAMKPYKWSLVSLLGAGDDGNLTQGNMGNQKGINNNRFFG